LIAVLIEWLGFHWDIAYHADFGRDRFLTLPHQLIIGGVACAFLVAFVSLTRNGRTLRRGAHERPGMALLGGSVILTAGVLAFDDWSHRQFGVDAAVWSPAHVVGLMTLVVAMFGILVDQASFSSSKDRSIAIVHGALLAVSTTYLFEYDFGYPHYRLLWAPVAMAFIFAFSVGSARAATRWRWTATTMVLTAVALRLGAMAMNAAVGRSLLAPPLGFIAGGVVHDLVMRRTGSRLRSVAAGLAGWAAVAAVQIPWLRVAGKVWWPDGILLAGILLGGFATVIAGLAGRGVGRFIAAARRSLNFGRRPPRLRPIAVGAAAVLLAAGIVATVGPQWTPGHPSRMISYSVKNGRARVVIPGARSADWVSVFGPRAPIGLFGPGVPPPGPRAVFLFRSFIPPDIQGPRLRSLRSFPLEAPRSWLGALTWKGGAFEGPVGGTGEYVAFWYVGRDAAMTSVVERGTEGRVQLLQRSFGPPEHHPLAVPVGVGAVALLAFIEVAMVAVCLQRAVRIARQSAGRSGYVSAEVD
jgi:hypothetical protein